MSIENPAPELTGADGLVLVPDFVARLRWNARSNAARSVTGATHIQAALLLRQLRGEVAGLQEATVSTGAIGATVSGVFVPPWRAHDRVKFAAYAGSGIGRYIKDLEKLGGQDAVYDATRGTLRALSVMSGYIGYEWLWRPTITSTVTYGIVNVSNLDIQPENALHRTQRTSVNVTWTPIPQGDLVAEFLSGRRVDKSLESGASSQLQLGWVFHF